MWSCFLCLKQSGRDLNSFSHEVHLKFAILVSKDTSPTNKSPTNGNFFTMRGFLVFHQMFFSRKLFLTKIAIEFVTISIHYMMLFPMIDHVTFLVKPFTTDITVEIFVELTVIRLIMRLTHVPIQFFTCCYIDAYITAYSNFS